MMKAPLDNPLVSIIIPVYNGERYLAECLDGICGQTLSSLEILCINDGSTDASAAILRTYAGRDARIQVIDKANTGYGNSMNLGLKLVCGDYVGIVEADDIPSPEMFATLHKLAERHALDMARCNFYRYRAEDGTIDPKELPPIPFNTVFRPLDVPMTFCQQPSVWANIYKNTFIRRNNLTFRESPGAAYQDLAFSFKAYACAERFLMIDEPLIRYRVDNALASVRSKGNVFSVCDEFAEIERYLHGKGLMPRLRHHVFRAKFISYSWNLRRLDPPEKRLFAQKCAQEFRRHLFRGDMAPRLFTERQIKRVLSRAFLSPLGDAAARAKAGFRRLFPFFGQLPDG